MSKHFLSVAVPVVLAIGSSIVLYHLLRPKNSGKKNSHNTTNDELQNNPQSSKSTNALNEELNNVLKLPCINFEAFSRKDIDPENYLAECFKVADALHKYGVCIVRDPRVAESDNDIFLDMVENYFGLSDGIRDARPDFAYQVGVTPAFTERPRNHCKVIGAMGPDNKPLSICPPELDPKWRFFWRIGPTPEQTNFPFLNADAVIPPEFPEWKDRMDIWGNKMLDAITTLAEMAAEGFHMPSDAFTKRMKFGPHLLAPTGSDFNNFGTLGTVLAGYHYDLNFMTIHGKSRFPGLSIWTRDGKRYSVAVPDGCLLVQAGKQIEYLTGGHVMAGFHEVVVAPSTVEVINARKNSGKSLWRVSSTLFGHIQSDEMLEPLPPFNTPEALIKYAPVYTGDQVSNELQAISLDRSKGAN